jgi:NADPH-dependent curcumin reductase CurA
MMRQWVLAGRPDGLATIDNFRLEDAPVPKIDDGEILVRTLYLGVAPVMLRYMTNEAAFERPLAIGDVMPGRGVAEVVESRHHGFATGDRVQAKLGWREYARIVPDDPYFLTYKMRNPDLPASHGISSLAMSGFTALIGMREIAGVERGDRVLVSGAAGGVGSQCAFVARALGAETIVGIAGGPEKCRLLTERLGFDAAIDYKREPVAERLDACFPDGIDVYFDNVFGDLLDQVLLRIRRRSRIALCGRMSEYLKPADEYHPFRNLWRLGLQDAKLEAFFVYDHFERFGEYEDTLAEWVREGKLVPLEHVRDGFEEMPAALVSLYEGGNSGVLMVRVG